MNRLLLDYIFAVICLTGCVSSLPSSLFAEYVDSGCTTFNQVLVRNAANDGSCSAGSNQTSFTYRCTIDGANGFITAHYVSFGVRNCIGNATRTIDVSNVSVSAALCTSNGNNGSIVSSGGWFAVACGVQSNNAANDDSGEWLFALIIAIIFVVVGAAIALSLIRKRRIASEWTETASRQTDTDNVRQWSDEDDYKITSIQRPSQYTERLSSPLLDG